jgi:PAS domain S-box-containing protein
MWASLRYPKLTLKIVALGAGSTIVTAAILVGLAVTKSREYDSLAQREVNQLIESDLDHIEQGVVNLVRTSDQALTERNSAGVNVAKHFLRNAGAITFSRETVTWHWTEFETADYGTVTLPKMLIGGKWLGQNYIRAIPTPVVDEISWMVQAEVTLFQRMNEQGDMLRVATTVVDSAHKRVVGNRMAAFHSDGSPEPIVNAVLRGETFKGLIHVRESRILASYSPLRDAKGEIIGMMFVGVNTDSVSIHIRSAIMNTTVGASGYVFVIGGKGKDQGRYIISHWGARDGELIWNSQDDDNRSVVHDLVRKGITLRDGEFATITYKWRNPEDSNPRWKMARLAYYEPWDWVIGTSVYLDEMKHYEAVLNAGRSRMTTTMLLAGVGIMLVVAGLGSLLAWHAMRPVREMTAVVDTIVEGNLDRRVEVRTHDEIGRLAQSFNVMTDRLSESIAVLHESEKKYRSIFENALEGIFQSTLEGDVITANPAMVRMLGYYPTEYRSEMIGSIEERLYVHPEVRRNMVATLLQHGVVHEYEAEVRRRDGKIIWVAINAYLVKDKDGNPLFIEGFVYDCSERKRTALHIQNSLNEKELLLKEIHHRVKNNMQVIMSLLNLQAMRATDVRMRDFYAESQSRIRSMALIHELLYHTGTFGSVDLLEYCRRLVPGLFGLYRIHDIGISIEGETLMLDLDQAIPCGLIVNELVSNSMKHAFPSGGPGAITIRVGRDNDNCRLVVSDNGVGLPADATVQKSSTVGMLVVSSLVQQIEGTMENSSGPGLTTTVTFPLSKA